MEPERFENNVKRLLEEREIQPSAASWEMLEQRLEKKSEKRPFLLWMSAAAAIASIFFVLGSYFNASVTQEGPQMAEQEPAQPVLEKRNTVPEVIQLAASEENGGIKEEKKTSEKRTVKNVIFETPFPEETSRAEEQIAAEMPSEVTYKEPEDKIILAAKDSHIPKEKPSSKVSDLEVEALLLLATAELKSDSTYTVNSSDLLHQVEYELDQSFRQKVFEVVKEGFSKAKTAVVNRDF